MSTNNKESILIIDDDLVFLQQIKKSFLRRGYTASTANNMAEAIQACQSYSFDWISIDLRLEKDSGLTILQEVRNLLPKARVLILTGFGSIATTVAALKLGAVNYLQKPAHVDEIIQALKQPDFEKDRTSSMSPPSLARAEWEYIQRILDSCDGNISKAARILGIHRRSLQRKLLKYPPKN